MGDKISIDAAFEIDETDLDQYVGELCVVVADWPQDEDHLGHGEMVLITEVETGSVKGFMVFAGDTVAWVEPKNIRWLAMEHNTMII